ncbi:hypothetical protein [Corynebacterium efficiens YS-314]|uniref:Uncharacterized protein n=1 Tax=Corynebacterium efficiens (strain DSM 44549 / YS-314 / AJ 12310 / JCM 11189 / NBRC 100395) TaxID=196164 RepID=Q8FQG4_COREF|nr:hypothetical protein [Corynebacterium efficiens YS-314]
MGEPEDAATRLACGFPDAFRRKTTPPPLCNESASRTDTVDNEAVETHTMRFHTPPRDPQAASKRSVEYMNRIDSDPSAIIVTGETGVTDVVNFGVVHLLLR